MLEDREFMACGVALAWYYDEGEPDGWRYDEEDIEELHRCLDMLRIFVETCAETGCWIRMT
jgi:hypothetical protein